MSNETFPETVREQAGGRVVARDIIAPADMAPCCRSWLVEQVMVEARVMRKTTPTGRDAEHLRRS